MGDFIFNRLEVLVSEGRSKSVLMKSIRDDSAPCRCGMYVMVFLACSFLLLCGAREVCWPQMTLDDIVEHFVWQIVHSRQSF